MVRTLTVRTQIPSDRRLLIDVPADVPTGPVEVVVVITTSRTEMPVLAGTAADMARSPLFGLWAHRDDIGDSMEYARQLRLRAERRLNGQCGSVA